MSAGSHQRYWITGASSGLGRALAVRLAQQGHDLILSSRKREALEALAKDYPEQILVLPCDVADTTQMQGLFTNHASGVDTLDGIFLCAGQCEYIDLPDFDLRACSQLMTVNFQGTLNACAAAYPLLQEAVRQGRPRPFIAGLCSMSSYLGFPRAEAYGASKAAMAYFLDSLRADIGKEVDVITVYLGFVDTPMTARNDFPMPFMQSPELTAEAILKKIAKRPLRINYPWRLHFVLKTFSHLQGIWYHRVVPRLRRSGESLS